MSNDDYVVGRAYGEMAPNQSSIYETLLEKAQREIEEQARLLGMGSEREARLITERDEVLATLKVVEQSHHSSLYREGELKRERDHYKQALEQVSSSSKEWLDSLFREPSEDFVTALRAWIDKKLNEL